ncbi:MAG: hypothetical protein ABI832_02260 [bacterium]
MIRFVALLAALQHDPDALARYQTEVGPADFVAAEALLTGRRPRRLVTLDTLMHWAAEVAAVPDWLLAASMEVSGDRAETAALLLPPPVGEPLGLAEVVDALARATPVTAHAVMLRLWARLPAMANVVVNRLAAGSFRTAVPKPRPVPTGEVHHLYAVMVLVQPAGPEVTLALWQGGVAVPIGRMPLTLPEVPEIMAWVRGNTLGKFGPVRQVPPELVFQVAYAGLTENRRRKSGIELGAPRITAWVRDGTAGQLDDLIASHAER